MFNYIFPLNITDSKTTVKTPTNTNNKLRLFMLFPIPFVIIILTLSNKSIFYLILN